MPICWIHLITVDSMLPHLPRTINTCLWITVVDTRDCGAFHDERTEAHKERLRPPA